MERCVLLRRKPLLEQTPPAATFAVVVAAAAVAAAAQAVAWGCPSAAPLGFARNETSPNPLPPFATPTCQTGPGTGELGTRKLCTLDADCISHQKP